MSITFVAAGTGAGGVGAVTPGMPAGATGGDFLLLVVEGEGEDASDDGVPSGGAWTVIESVASSTDGAGDRTRCTVAWAWYDAGINLEVPDAGNHTLARVYAYRNVDSSDPIGAFTSGSSATNATSHSVASGLTTEADASMVVLAFTHGDDGTSPSTVANASLTGVAAGGSADTSENSGGTVGTIQGIKTTAGGAGTFTWTTAVSEEVAWVALELKESAPGTGITHVGADSFCSAVGSDASGTVTMPSVVDGDVAVLVIHSFNGTDYGLPSSGLSGWTLQANLGGGTWVYRTMCWTRVLTSADSADDVTPTFSSATGWVALLSVYRGVDTADPVDAVSAHTRSTGSSAVFSSITTSNPNSLIVASPACKDPVTQGGGFGTPSGFTEAVDAAGADQFRNGALFHQIRASAGAGAPGSSSLGLSTDYATFSIALNAETAPPDPPTVDTNPSDLTVLQDVSDSISIVATGASSYQWYKGASGVTTTPVSGATSATLTRTWALADAGDYWCRVTNSAGSDDSTAATVTVTAQTPTTSDPSNLTVTTGTAGSFVVSTTYATSWQWYKGASGVTTTPVASATTETLNRTWLYADAGTYWCRATGPGGTVDSAAATLTVNAPPSEITHVGSDTVSSNLGGKTSQTVTLPTVLDGDYALLSFQSFNSADRGLPIGGVAGWDLVANLGGGSWAYRTVVYGRALAVSDSGDDITVTMSGNTGWVLRVSVFRGVDTDDPIDAVSAHRTGNGSSSVAFNSVTVSQDGNAVIALFACKDPITQGGGFAPPSTYAELTDSSTTNSYRNGASAWKEIASAGSVSPGNSALGRTSDWASLTVALNVGEGAAPVFEDPSGFTPIESATQQGFDFRPGPSPAHLDLIRDGAGGIWAMAIELVDSLTAEPIFSTVATADDEAEWWGVVPDGPVRFARGRQAQRSVSVTIPLDDQLRLLPRGSGHPAHPVTRNLLRVWAGHRLTPSSTEFVPVVTLVVDSVEADDDSGAPSLVLTAVDLSALLDAGFPPGGWRVEAGSNVIDEVERALALVLPDMAVITSESTEFTLPAVEKEEGDSIGQFIDEALGSIGMEITTDELGRFRIATVAPTWCSTADPAEWKYGDEGIPVQAVRTRFQIPDTPSGLTLSGASLSGDDEAEIKVTIYDEDPSSLTFWDVTNRPPWATIAEVTNEYVDNDARAKVAAWAQFRHLGQGGQVVTFTAAPNPALRPDQTIEFSRETLGVWGGLWRVLDVSLPVDVGALMDATIARSWDPALEDAELGDLEPPSTGITTASETFDYGAGYNGVLYDKPNWHTQGNDTLYPRFNQVRGGDFRLGGMGRWETQMDSTNHWTSLIIGDLESNSHGVGPLVRCDSTGSTIRGYTASVVRNGGAKNKIELRRWDSKFVYSVIGTYTHSGTLVGSTVRIEADGPELTVKVGATVVLEATDSTHTSGRWVGFHNSAAWNNDWEGGVL